jgi:hypothetical protein
MSGFFFMVAAETGAVVVIAFIVLMWKRYRN